MSFSTFVSSLKKISSFTHSIEKKEEQTASLVSLACKTSIVALSCIEYISPILIPYAGWIHLGLGVISVVAHVKGNLHKQKIRTIKEGIETGSLVVIGSLAVTKVISVSTLGFSSLALLISTNSLYWLSVPSVIVLIPNLASKAIGNAKDIASESDDLLLKLSRKQD